MTENEYPESPVCSICRGTGEGIADGTSCPFCKGRGYIIPKQEDIYDYADYDMLDHRLN
jgi:DnaJ-class molecular chaperone